MNRSIIKLAVIALTLTLALAAVAAASAASREDVAKLRLENALAERLVDLNLTRSQLEELRDVISGLVQARQDALAQEASLLEQRKAAVLAKDGDAVRRIDEALREASRASHLREDPAAAAFVAGLTERQKLLLANLLGEPIAVDFSARPRPGLREAIMVHRVAPAASDETLAALNRLVEAMLE